MHNVAKPKITLSSDEFHESHGANIFLTELVLSITVDHHKAAHIIKTLVNTTKIIVDKDIISINDELDLNAAGMAIIRQAFPSLSADEIISCDLSKLNDKDNGNVVIVAKFKNVNPYALLSAFCGSSTTTAWFNDGLLNLEAKE